MKSLKSELNMLSADESEADGGDEGVADGGDEAEAEAGEAAEAVGAVDDGGGATEAVEVAVAEAGAGAVAVADVERADAMAPDDELEVVGDAANGAASDGGEDATAGTGAGAGA